MPDILTHRQQNIELLSLYPVYAIHKKTKTNKKKNLYTWLIAGEALCPAKAVTLTVWVTAENQRKWVSSS